MSNKSKYPILPHVFNETKFKKIKDNPFTSLNKMNLFTPPLRTTNSVLVKMNIKDYLVSSKPDGIFTALYIDNDGLGYYLHPVTKSLYKIGRMTNPLYFNVICNGELMEKNHYDDYIYPYILLFDILEWGTKKLSYLLTERINICQNIIKYFEIDPETKFLEKIAVKSYVPIKSIYRIISSKKIRKDGLIFTPKQGKPGKNCIRWKPFPTLTVGLEWCNNFNDYLIYFRDTNHKKQFRKKYYNIDTRSYSIFKSECTCFFSRIVNKKLFNKYYLEENPNWDKKKYPKNILIEIFVDKDPFNPNWVGNYMIRRFRPDKKYPDHINEVNNIINLMENPVNISDIVGKKSIYKYWIPPSKKYRNWVKYSKKIKNIIYSRWVKRGSLLDMCAGRGSDAILLYYLSKKKNIDEIHCLEKDDMQINALRDFTSTIRKNNFFGMNCILKINQYDMNNPDLSTFYNKKFDTIICSNAIQFSLDPFKENHGVNNIKRLLKDDGILILIFMNGSKLSPSSNKVCDCVNIECANKNYHVISDLSSEYEYFTNYSNNNEISYILTEKTENNKQVSDIFDPIEAQKENMGLYYKYDEVETRRDNLKYDKTHIWVQLPTSLNAIREPIIYDKNLVFQFRNMGFTLLEMKSFNDLIKSKEYLSKTYTYAIFKNSSSQKIIPSILNIIDDILFEICGYLNICDIFSLGKTHRVFTDKCFKYMKLNPVEWYRLNYETVLNKCSSESNWS